MRKTFEHNNKQLEIDIIGHGVYRLTSGMVSTTIYDASIYDWCDDDSDPEKHEQAKREGYGYITRAIEAAE